MLYNCKWPTETDLLPAWPWETMGHPKSIRVLLYFELLVWHIIQPKELESNSLFSPWCKINIHLTFRPNSNGIIKRIHNLLAIGLNNQLECRIWTSHWVIAWDWFVRPDLPVHTWHTSQSKTGLIILCLFFFRWIGSKWDRNSSKSHLCPGINICSGTVVTEQENLWKSWPGLIMELSW